MGNVLRIAIRNVVRNRRRTAISAAAIFLGVCVMVSIRGFVNGFQNSMIDNTTNTTLGAFQVHRTGFGTSIEISPLTLDFAVTPDLVSKLRSLPGTTGVAARIRFPLMVSRGDQTVFAFASAVDPTNEYAVCPLASSIVDTGTALSTAPGMLISSQLAQALPAHVGDTLALIANDRDGVMNGLELPVVGIFTGRFPGMEKSIIVPLLSAQALLRMEGRATELAVGMRDVRAADGPAAEAARLLGAGYEVETWRDIAKQLKDIIEFQNVLLPVISVIFLVVALAGIVNTMMMSVLERVREIGTMMAMGVRRRQIVGLFVTEAAALGLVAGLFGDFAGWVVVQILHVRGIHLGVPGVTADNVLRPTVAVSFLATTAVLAMAGAVLASLYPAWSASRLRPVEALQHV